MLQRERLEWDELDYLAVLVECNAGYEYRELYEFLNVLHDQGVYKRLHLYVPGQKEEHRIDEMAKLNSLIKLFIFYNPSEPLTLPILNDLREIRVNNTREIFNLADVAIKFPNLERVCLEGATSTDLLMFISRTVNLIKIEVVTLSAGINFDENKNILDLVALNKERQKLSEAEKVTLYVDEEVYFQTKWAMKGTDFSHIVMRRAESHDWDHSFEQ